MVPDPCVVFVEQLADCTPVQELADTGSAASEEAVSVVAKVRAEPAP